MELIGALSEPRARARWERLARRLAENRHQPLAEPRIREVRPRQGWVWPAVRRVLVAADAPMPPVAIYAAVVEDLGTRVSTSMIKNELRRRLTMMPLELGQDGDSGYFLISSST